MNNKSGSPSVAQVDHLGDYVVRAGKLHSKLATIISHQKESAASLSRAAEHLRSMANLGADRGAPENRNRAPGIGKFLDANA